MHVDENMITHILNLHKKIIQKGNRMIYILESENLLLNVRVFYTEKKLNAIILMYKYI